MKSKMKGRYLILVLIYVPLIFEVSKLSLHNHKLTPWIESFNK